MSMNINGLIRTEILLNTNGVAGMDVTVIV